jgi:hypothetical protein
MTPRKTSNPYSVFLTSHKAVDAYQKDPKDCYITKIREGLTARNINPVYVVESLYLDKESFPHEYQHLKGLFQNASVIAIMDFTNDESRHDIRNAFKLAGDLPVLAIYDSKKTRDILKDDEIGATHKIEAGTRRVLINKDSKAEAILNTAAALVQAIHGPSRG